MLDYMPRRLTIRDLVLVAYQDVDDQNEFQQKLNRARNFFRHNFGDSSKSDLDGTRRYLKQVVAQAQTRLLYGLFIENCLVGQYGLRLFNESYILLDNALRFEAIGPRDIFSVVSKQLILFV